MAAEIQFNGEGDPGPIRSDPGLTNRIMSQFGLAFDFTDLEDWLKRVRQTLEDWRKGNRVVEIRQNIMETYACHVCGNDNPVRFRKEAGNVICLGKDDSTGCGTVVLEHYATEGDDRRTHSEDPETQNRVHRGSAPNPLLSSSSNTATALRGEGKMGRVAREVQMTHDANERETARDTRTSTKDSQKLEAWRMIEQVGTQLQLPPRALSGAKERFAHYRDAKQHVNKREAVIAVCILDAVHTYRMNIGFYKNKKFKCATCGLIFPALRDLNLHVTAAHPSRHAQDRARKSLQDRMDLGLEKDLALWTVEDVSKWARSVAFSKGIELADVQEHIDTLMRKLDSRGVEEEKKNSAVASATFLLRKSHQQKTAGQRLLQSARRGADIAHLLGMPSEQSDVQSRFVKGLWEALRDLTRRAKQLAKERERLLAEKKRISVEEARDERNGIKRRKIEGEEEQGTLPVSVLSKHGGDGKQPTT